MRILIVDDDGFTLEALKRLVALEGHDVITAQDGAEALQLFRKHRPQMVLADWMMPQMNGLDLCRAIRSEQTIGYAYFIVITALTEKARIVETLDAGADEHLCKPIEASELSARIRAGERIVRLEIELAKRHAELEDQVFGVLGHELRTPLAALRGTAEFLLTEDARELAEFDLFIRNIHGEVLKLISTVERLLEAARINSGRAMWNWSKFSLEEVCHSAMDSVRALVDHAHVDIECQVAPGAITMHGDDDAVRRLIINLARNSQKHTRHGHIRLEARNVTEASGKWIEISVNDTGDGIAPELAQKLGDAFALNAGVVGGGHIDGVGLGLTICKAITAAHGGAMRITSQVGEGTTVTVRLRADLSGPSSISTQIETNLRGRSADAGIGYRRLIGDVAPG